jgi:WhiB family redox-sensing transcriptional regulator
MLTQAQLDQAACIGEDTEKFFVELTHKNMHLIRAAKNICRSCPIVADCLEVAIENKEQGIWGGTTDPERTTLRRRRNALYRKVSVIN